MNLQNSGFDKNATYFEHNLDSSEIPTVFIHGVGLDHTMWLPQKKNFHDKNVIYYDLLIHGRCKKGYKSNVPKPKYGWKCKNDKCREGSPINWKVVKENEVQLAVYAIYAKQKWDIDLKHIRLFDVYLNKQIPVKVKPTDRLISSANEFIQTSIDSMKELLTDEDNNKTEIDLFPVVSEDRESYPCTYCSFQTVCYD